MPEKLISTIEAGLTPATKEVFQTVSELDCIRNLFLCDGTGQSIQMNHRLSEGLDFELIDLKKERPKLFLFKRNDDFNRMVPKYDITPEGICERIRLSVEMENQ